MRDKAQVVPSFGIQGEAMGAEANIAAWREAVATLFEVDELGAGEPGRFHADLQSYVLGPLLFGRSRASGQRFRRTAETVARSGVDHIVVQLYVSGGYEGVAGAAPIRVGPGDICVLDLAQTLETRATAFENFNLVIPRPMIDRRLPQPDALHGLVLPAASALTQLLGRHFAALFDCAPRLTLDQCQAVADGAIALIVACLRGELERRDAVIGGADDLSLLRIRQHIEARLDAADLSAESVAGHFGLSRASLYRLFSPLGGVADYIRSRRLHRAFFDLAAATSRGPRVSEVARRWNLGSEANFSRAFKAAYGVSPRAARALLSERAPEDGAAASASPLTRWMREIAPRVGA
ncbi:AraC-like DNA-binding protein [Rhodoblastus acidophilus]|uniref:AraC-like ligand-binding domain-containing protein n=1 Tax=Rhodoblastus acidophilus TaxID=1074 RepID=UPI0022253E84|nr:helix-turn-helix domain-containing protein [Rhodoblastus acidophilus]MCW2317993.1 AraC-like DNA-binding protein [Rhodoblastus acidophilus]